MCISRLEQSTTPLAILVSAHLSAQRHHTDMSRRESEVPSITPGTHQGLGKLKEVMDLVCSEE